MSQYEKVKIFDRVKELRKALNCSQESLAKRLGISGNYVYQIEAGTKTPGDRLLRDIEALELSVSLGQAESHFVKPGVAEDRGSEYRTTDEWKRHAQQLEAENRRLRAALRELASEDINSAPPSDAATLARRAGAAYDAAKPNPPA